jgi:RNA polymerase sigma-32 factor
MRITKTHADHDYQQESDLELLPSTQTAPQIDPLRRYKFEIGQYKVLPQDEQTNLAIRYKERNEPEAITLLVASNLRLVFKIARDFQRPWMQNLPDLIQEGNLGLIRAAEKFDPYRNVKFSYYASFWIKAYILKFILDNWRLVKIGTTEAQRKLFFRLNKEKEKLINEGFEPEPGLLSQRLGLSEKAVIDMDQRLNSRDVSLNAPVKDYSNTDMINYIPAKSKSPEEHVVDSQIKELLHQKINEFKSTITHREREIFEERIFAEDPLTLQKLGDRFGITRERVRQVEKEVIVKIKTFFKHEIPDFIYFERHRASI